MLEKHLETRISVHKPESLMTSSVQKLHLLEDKYPSSYSHFLDLFHQHTEFISDKNINIQTHSTSRQ